jgi:hypothetical protein
MLTYVHHNISKNRCKRNQDATRSHPSWLLPHVCMHSVHMTEILILFLRYYDIFSMHRLHRSVFPDTLIISAGAFTKLDHDATRNVIGTQSATPQPFVVKSCDLQVWWIPVSTTISISCPICIRAILLKFYVHTSNQFLGMFTPFPSCFSTTSNIWPTLNHCPKQANNFLYTPLMQ